MGAGTGRSVDMAQLGLSFDTGAATVGLAFIDQNTESGKDKKSAYRLFYSCGRSNLAGSWMDQRRTFETDGSPGKLGMSSSMPLER